jgi:hypothetical protein
MRSLQMHDVHSLCVGGRRRAALDTALECTTVMAKLSKNTRKPARIQSECHGPSRDPGIAKPIAITCFDLRTCCDSRERIHCRSPSSYHTQIRDEMLTATCQGSGSE